MNIQERRAVRRITKHALFVQAKEMYRKLRDQGRKKSEALHAAASSFGLEDKEFAIYLSRP